MKTIQVLKAILIGVLIGATIFFVPFPFRFFFGFFLIFFAFRFFARGKWGRRNWREDRFAHAFWNPSYTQRWRNMSDEERNAFIKKMESELFNTTISTEK